MGKVLAMLFSLLLLASCERNNDLHLNASAISSIDVIPMQPTSQNQFRQITNRQTITQLTSCLNHASKELNKFYPSYRLVFHTSTKAESAVVRSRSLRMDDGRRYNADCDIEQFLR